ncbi:hypothetical protein [Sphingomonas sp. LT1P40]|uniref:hypothetical protein n=1 Tax=Alteristakelama amylovorans TaxID=3096166 RepID=UPI002FCC36C7
MGMLYTRTKRDIGLRVCGAMLGVTAFGLARLLPGYAQSGTQALALLLAGLTFVTASIGAAMLFEGAGLLEQTVVSARWADYRSR